VAKSPPVTPRQLLAVATPRDTDSGTNQSSTFCLASTLVDRPPFRNRVFPREISSAAYGLSAGKRVRTLSLQQPLAFCNVSSIYVKTRYLVDNLKKTVEKRSLLPSNNRRRPPSTFAMGVFPIAPKILSPRRTAHRRAPRHSGNCRNDRNVTSPSIKSAFSPFWPNNFLPKNGRSLSVVASTDRSPFRVAGRFASYQSARFQLWRFSKETTQPNEFCSRSLISGWAAVAARGGRWGRDVRPAITYTNARAKRPPTLRHPETTERRWVGESAYI
jgi:hypothetical protein